MKRVGRLTLVVGFASIAIAMGVLVVPDPAPAAPVAEAEPDPTPAPTVADIQFRPIGTAARTGAVPSRDERCPEGKRTSLRIERAGKVVSDMPLADVLNAPASTEIASGRHRTQRGLPLAALLAGHDDVTALELVPCTGEIERIDAAKLREAPEALVLVLNSKEFSKIVNLGAPNLPRTLPKNIAAVRLLP